MSEAKRRPGRPSQGGPTPSRSIRLGAVYDQADKLAKRRGEKLPDVIERALHTYVASHKEDMPTTQLRPTPAGVALLKTVADGQVTYDNLDASYFNHATNRTVTDAVVELISAGWVVRDVADVVRLTAAGRFILFTTKEQM